MQSGSILNINSVKVVLFGEYHHIWVVSHRDHLGSGLSSFWPNRKQKVHLHFHTTMIFFQSFSLQLPLASFTTPPCFLVGAPSLGPEPPCSQIEEIHKNFNFSCKILTSKSHLASYPTLAPLESKEKIVSYLTGLLSPSSSVVWLRMASSVSSSCLYITPRKRLPYLIMGVVKLGGGG